MFGITTEQQIQEASENIHDNFAKIIVRYIPITVNPTIRNYFKCFWVATEFDISTITIIYSVATVNNRQTQHYL